MECWGSPLAYTASHDLCLCIRTANKASSQTTGSAAFLLPEEKVVEIPNRLMPDARGVPCGRSSWSPVRS